MKYLSTNMPRYVALDLGRPILGLLYAIALVIFYLAVIVLVPLGIYLIFGREVLGYTVLAILVGSFFISIANSIIQPDYDSRGV